MIYLIMNKQFSNSRKVVLPLIILTLIAFSVWEYKQSQLIKELKELVSMKKVISKTSGRPQFFSVTTVARPFEKAILLSEKEEKNIFDKLESKIIKLRSEQQTINRVPLLKEEEWLNISKFVDRVAQIFCPLDSEGLVSEGSGLLVDERGHVLTNYHVTEGMVGNRCLITFASDYRQPPDQIYIGYRTDNYDPKTDYAWLYLETMFAPQKGEIKVRSFPYIPACDSNVVKIGDPIIILGYPKYGGPTITATDGIISGSIDNYFKTNAKIDAGNSGGPVLLDDSQYECYVGIATFAISGKSEALNYAIKTRAISGYSWKNYKD